MSTKDAKLSNVHDREVGEQERSLANMILLVLGIVAVVAGLVYAAMLIARTVGH